MSVRPIDFQILVPKSTEVSKLQQLQKENSEMQQNFLTVSFKEKIESSKRKINHRTEAEKVRIERDESSPKREGKNKNKRNKKEKSDPLPRKKLSHIDIKV